jgi:hypothetical protein
MRVAKYLTALRSKEETGTDKLTPHPRSARLGDFIYVSANRLHSPRSKAMAALRDHASLCAIHCLMGTPEVFRIVGVEGDLFEGSNYFRRGTRIR